MADIDKVLFDDHAKVKRLFADFERGGSIDLVLTICQELTVHAEIEEEVLYPIVRDELSESMADRAEDEHELIRELVAQIEEEQPSGAELRRVVGQLKRVFESHVTFEQEEIFTALNQRVPNELWDMGRMAFAKRQEILGGDESAMRQLTTRTIPNAGW
jgi:hemerythrin-like domain-containing protein